MLASQRIFVATWLKHTLGFNRPTLTALVALAMVIALIAPAGADPASDRQTAEQKVRQSAASLETSTEQARKAWADYEAAKQQLPGVRQAAAEARGKVIAAQVEANEASRKADIAAEELKRAETQYDLADDKVQHAKQRFNTFVRNSYESSRYLSSAMVLAAKSPDQVVAAVEYVQALGIVRQDEINQMRAARLRAGQHRATTANYKHQMDEANAQAQRALAAAEQYAAEVEAAEKKTDELVEQQKTAYDIAQQEKAASQQAYEQAQAQSQRIEQELREAASRARQGNSTANSNNEAAPNPAPNGRGSRGLIKPVNGFKTSDFGSRYDPYYHVWQLHAGTDFGAASGAPVWAAAGGRIIQAGWAGGYGNYICVLHGDLGSRQALSTCYAHLSAIMVGRGQQVSQGQVIGRVGSTGASTGPHLHFEVRLDGGPVNPLGWL